MAATLPTPGQATPSGTADILPSIAEITRLLEHLQQVQDEVRSIHPQEIGANHIPSANDQLGTVLKTNETAAGNILDCCEQLQAIAADADGKARERLLGIIAHLFEACDFQDLTGQRIRLVRLAFDNIDRKIASILTALGLGGSAPRKPPQTTWQPLAPSAGSLLAAELERLAACMQRIRADVVSIGPGAESSASLRAMNDQLLAVIDNATSSANRILTACEQLDEVAKQMPGLRGRRISAVIARIYEACSFQDLTSQKVAKVVSLLSEIETKIDHLALALGVHPEQDVPPAEVTAAELMEKPNDVSLLKGPPIPGQGMDQSEIDRLLAQG
jgi:chemotaxis protein CheZ